MTGSDGKWKHYKSGAVRSNASIDPNLGSSEGFYYGVLEFNARIPSGNIDVKDLWPALWTYSELGTEIDIVDGSINGESITSNLIDWKYAPRPWSTYWTQVFYTPSSYTTFGHNVVYQDGAFVKNADLYYQNQTGGNLEAKAHGIVVDQDVWNTGENFSDGYNRFAVSWEPDKVTFYINGREIMTIDDYWNTDFHTSYPNQTYNLGFPSMAVLGNGSIIYDQYGKDLSCFEYRNCEFLNPTSHIGILKSMGALDSEESALPNDKGIAMSMSPNPASDFVHISADGGDINQIKVIDLMGKVILERNIEQTRDTDVYIDALVPGLYTVLVHLSDGSVSTNKLIVR